MVFGPVHLLNRLDPEGSKIDFQVLVSKGLSKRECLYPISVQNSLFVGQNNFFLLTLEIPGGPGTGPLKVYKLWWIFLQGDHWAIKIWVFLGSLYPKEPQNWVWSKIHPQTGDMAWGPKLTLKARGKKIRKFGNRVQTSRTNIFCKNKWKLMILFAFS